MFPFQIGPLGRVRANARGRARATRSDLFSEPACKSAREYIRSSSLARTNRRCDRGLQGTCDYSGAALATRVRESRHFCARERPRINGDPLPSPAARFVSPLVVVMAVLERLP